MRDQKAGLSEVDLDRKQQVARSPGRPKKVKTVPIRLLYDYWNKDGVRYGASETPVEMPLEDARFLLGEGKAERADPLPGDD